MQNKVICICYVDEFNYHQSSTNMEISLCVFLRSHTEQNETGIISNEVNAMNNGWIKK